ncbi:MAG TPA: hypothetical protein ENF75_00830 [Acidilobales archaeon]|nr:hypothetical protein [Acidilobales archaeon]
MGYLISWPEKLVKVRVYVPKDLRDTLLEALYEFKEIHLKEVKLKFAGKPSIDLHVKVVEEAKNVIEGFIKALSSKHEVPVNVYVSPSQILGTIKELTDELKPVVDDLKGMLKTLATYKDALNNHEKLYKYLKPIAKLMPNLLRDELQYEGRYVTVQTWIIPVRNLNRLLKSGLISKLSIIGYAEVSDEEKVMVLGYPSHIRTDVMKFLESIDAKPLSIPEFDGTVKDYVNSLSNKLSELRDLLRDYRVKIDNVINKYLPKVALLKGLVSSEEERLSVVLKSLESKHVCVYEGWVPVSLLKAFSDALYSKVRYIHIEEVEESSDEEIPTKMKNPKGIDAFEVLTRLYGVPNYKEWDPTPLIAYSFVIFFGLMFADVIYGVLLLIITKLFLPKLVDNPESEGFKKFQKMLYVCAISGMVFGVISGSYLGDFPKVYMGIEPPVFLDILSPLIALQISLLIGLIHVTLAHVLTFIRGLRTGNKAEAINELGIIVAVAAGTPYILESLLRVDVPFIPDWFVPYLLYMAFAGIGLILVGKYMALKAFASILWIFDLTGFLGDVLSYTRLAGVGLATFYLASSFNAITKLLADGLINILPIHVVGLMVAIVICGILVALTHIMNLALSTLGAFIHALRLCFVEFISKFYEGTGKEFKPLTFKTFFKVELSPSSL